MNYVCLFLQDQVRQEQAVAVAEDAANSYSLFSRCKLYFVKCLNTHYTDNLKSQNMLT